MNGLFDWRNKFLNLLCLEEDGGSGGSSGESGDDGGQGNDDNPPKTFTQEELNSIIAAEKRKNSASVYKALGFDNPDDAKAFVEKYKEVEEKDKSELDKSSERVKELEKEKAAEEKRARKAEYKFKAIESGCAAKDADDIVALAMSRVSDDKTFEEALKDVKESYPSLFNSSEGGTGTGGNPPRRTGGNDSVQGIGKRLAEQRKKAVKSESSFF